MKITNSEKRMNHNVKRLLVTIGITAGFITLTATQASAGLPYQPQRTDPQPELKTTMNRNLKRLLVTIGITAGFLTVTASQASAGLVATTANRPSTGTEDHHEPQPSSASSSPSASPPASSPSPPPRPAPALVRNHSEPTLRTR